MKNLLSGLFADSADSQPAARTQMLAAATMARRVSPPPVSLDVRGDVGVISITNPPVNALAIPGTSRAKGTRALLPLGTSPPISFRGWLP
jgi:hypothetical protein|tara:strand:+ start:2641 stop:2910 length:270 start_codon:yes stop_codon:yes gene_type:complete